MRFVIAMLVISGLWASALQAVEVGDDGLHKPDWLHATFKDLPEDLAEANAENKRLVILFEQRGCIYCTKMHEKIFPLPEIDALIRKKFYFVQMNLFGDERVTDFDGRTLSEKQMAVRWGVVFTPTMLFMPEAADSSISASQQAIMTMPGAFGKGTTLDLLNFVLEKGYLKDEHFQKYHARKVRERRATQ